MYPVGEEPDSDFKRSVAAFKNTMNQRLLANTTTTYAGAAATAGDLIHHHYNLHLIILPILLVVILILVFNILVLLILLHLINLRHNHHRSIIIITAVNDFVAFYLRPVCTIVIVNSCWRPATTTQTPPTITSNIKPPT